MRNCTQIRNAGRWQKKDDYNVLKSAKLCNICGPLGLQKSPLVPPQRTEKKILILYELEMLLPTALCRCRVLWLMRGGELIWQREPQWTAFHLLCTPLLWRKVIQFCINIIRLKFNINILWMYRLSSIIPEGLMLSDCFIKSKVFSSQSVVFYSLVESEK